MANIFSSVDLLDRARNVLILAGDLGRAFKEQYERQGNPGCIDPTTWDHCKPSFEQFGQAILELQNVIENPPDGFQSVADHLMETARIAKAIKKGVKAPEAHNFVHMDLLPSLNTVACECSQAVERMVKAKKLDDTFAFVEKRQPTVGIRNDTAGTKSDVSAPNESWESISGQLPKNEDEANLLKPVVADLLREIPEIWSEFDSDKLTAIQLKALFLLVAAGMVERRFRLHIEMFGHPTAFEASLTATGEYGIVEAIMPLNAVLWNAWQDAYQAQKAGAQEITPPFHCNAHKPEQWRLTDQGILARNDLSDGNEVRVFDFVLKRGFFGSGQVNGTAGSDSRPPVRGSGRLESYKEIKKSDNEPITQSVNINNWNVGGQAFAQAFAQFFEAAKNGKIVPPFQTPNNTGQAEGVDMAADGSLLPEAPKMECGKEAAGKYKDTNPPLGERARLVLAVLLNENAFDSDHRQRTEDIAVEAIGPSADPNQLGVTGLPR